MSSILRDHSGTAISDFRRTAVHQENLEPEQNLTGPVRGSALTPVKQLYANVPLSVWSKSLMLI
jgi:hypothetical protein